MKIFSVLATILFSIPLSAGDFVDKDIKSFLVKSHNSSIRDTTITLENAEKVSFPYLKFNGSGDSTITSRILRITGGGGDINVVGWVKNVSGTQNIELQIGVLESPETGISWHSIGTVTNDTTFVYAFQDQVFANHISNRFLIKIIQTGVQYNLVAIRVRKYQSK